MGSAATVTIDARRRGVTVRDIELIARFGAEVEISPEVTAAMAEGFAFANRASDTRPVYGRSTGVGANRGVPVADDDHGMRLLRSHATASGAPRDVERVRALLGVRIAEMASGFGGVAPEAVTGLVALLGDPPSIPEYVGLGTGDLNALATVGLVLTRRGLWQPRGDALAFMSSNAATLGDAALALCDLRRVSDAALVVAALTMVAARANGEAFSGIVEQVTPFAGAQRVCQVMRTLVDGMGPAARVQDSYGLRTLPQVHGPLIDALDRLEDVVTRLINAPTENPIVAPLRGIAHHGGFHLAYAAQALDATKLAVAQACAGSLSRILLLSNPEVTGLKPFLANDEPAASGAMMVEYTAAAALAELRSLAHPVSLQTVTISRGMEDGASFASLAARQALSTREPASAMLAAELVCAHRALRQSAVSIPDALVPVLARCGAAGLGEAGLAADGFAADGFADRDLSGDLVIARRLLPHLAELIAGG